MQYACVCMCSVGNELRYLIENTLCYSFFPNRPIYKYSVLFRFSLTEIPVQCTPPSECTLIYTKNHQNYNFTKSRLIELKLKFDIKYEGLCQKLSTMLVTPHTGMATIFVKD
jgi:hypothetical protein